MCEGIHSLLLFNACITHNNKGGTLPFIIPPCPLRPELFLYVHICPYVRTQGLRRLKKNEWSQEEHVNNLIKKKRSTTDTFISRAHLWGGPVFARHVSAFRKRKQIYFRVTIFCPLIGLGSGKRCVWNHSLFPSHSETGRMDCLVNPNAMTGATLELFCLTS